MQNPLADWSESDLEWKDDMLICSEEEEEEPWDGFSEEWFEECDHPDPIETEPYIEETHYCPACREYITATEETSPDGAA